MRNRTSVFLVCLLSQFCFGQISDRKPLHGLVVNDSINLESSFVDNINSKSRTFISTSGFFDLMVKENDTLLFSGIAFQPKRAIISSNDFDKILFSIIVIAIPNQLREVVVQKKVTPSFGNMQRILDKKYFDDAQSSPKNRLMPSDATIENGMDFVRIFKDVFKLIRRKKPQKTALNLEVNFTEVVTDKFKQNFFINKLKLSEHQIGLFLIFCENDPKSKMVIKSNSEFELMDFLIIKNEEFKTNIALIK